MDKALGYLSLAARAGRLATGADNCIDSLKRGKAKLIILASDASSNAVKRAEGMLYGRNIPLCRVDYPKDELAHASGRRGPVALAAIEDEGLAKAFANAAKTLHQQEE